MGISRYGANVMARCLSMSGLTKKDVFQNPIPYGTFTGAFGFHYGAQKVGALVIPSGQGQSERQIKLMEILWDDVSVRCRVLHGSSWSGRA